MNYSKIKGIIMVVLAAVGIVAAVTLVALQAGNTAAFYLGKNYGQNTPGGVNTALLMLCSAGGGVVLAGLIFLLVRGIRSIRTGRQLQRRQRFEHRLAEMERHDTPGEDAGNS